jgi:dTDP-4-dehydrorhamnose reductase
VWSMAGALLYRLRLQRQGDSAVLRNRPGRVGVPTWSRAIAEGTAGTVQPLLSNREEERAGTYHLTGDGHCSWHDFTTKMIRRSGVKPIPEIRAITTAELQTPARRPAYSVLSAQKCRDTLGLRSPTGRTS